MFDALELISRVNLFLEVSEHKESELRLQLEQMRHDATEKLKRQKNTAVSTLESENKTIQSRWAEKQKKAIESDSAIDNIHQRLMSSEPKYKGRVKMVGEDVPSDPGLSIDNAVMQLGEMRIAFVDSYKKFSEQNIKGSFSKAVSSGKANKILSAMAVQRATVCGIMKWLTPEIEKFRAEELKGAYNKSNATIERADDQYNREIALINKESETGYAELADFTLDLLNSRLPDEAFKSITAEIERVWNSMNKVPDRLESIVLVGGIFMRLKDYCDSNALISLVSAKAGVLCREGCLRLPVTVNLMESTGNALIIHGKSENQISSDLMNGMLYSFLLSIPPWLLTIDVIDPQNKGKSVSPFLAFRDMDCGVFNVSTDEESIQIVLNSINKHISSLIVDKFGSTYSNIWEYNEANEGNEIGIRILNIFDFPKGFTSKTIEVLNEILLHSSTCGVFVHMTYNTEIQMNKYEKNDKYLSELPKHFCCTYKILEGSVIHGPTGLTMIPMALPDSDALDDFVRQYGSIALQKSKQSHVVSFFDISGEMFKKSTTDGISIPIGMGERDTICVEFGKGTSHHMLIAGATGSGKSSLLHTIIHSAIYNYSPKEINLYLMDFKSGTEFKVYDRHDIPHIKLLAIDAMQEFGESILKELCDEISRRSNLFKDAGQQDLPGYIRATGQKLPRILIIIDEFQTLFDEGSNRAVAGHCAAHVGEITAKGRSYGIHLIMATQTMKVTFEKTALKNTTIEQMRSRIGLQCGEFDSKYLFKDSADDATREMRGPIGRAAYAWDYMQNQIMGLDVSYISDDERQNLLNQIAHICKDSDKTEIRVFEGRSKIPMPERVDAPLGHILLPLGEPISVSSPLVLNIHTRGRNNILLAGNNETVVMGLENVIRRGLTINSDVDIYLINGGEMAGASTHTVDIGPSVVRSASSDEEIVGLICEVHDAMNKRKNSSNDRKFICLYISDMQWIELIKKMMNGDRVYAHDYQKGLEAPADRNDTVTSRFLSLVREGNKYGIFTIITTKRPGDAVDVMRYQENLLKEMGHRLASSLTEKEGDVVLGPGITCMDDDHVAYYSDGVKPVLMFKPYHIG